MPLTPEEQKELEQLNAALLQSAVSRLPASKPAEKPKTNATDNEAGFLKYAEEQGFKGNELAALMAQTAHESGGFGTLEESGGGKDSYSGGKRYKGRGYIQLTHDYNYKKYGDKIGVDLVNNPELAADPEIAKKIAIEYWKDNVRPGVRNWNDVYSHSKPINRPSATDPSQINGMEDRQSKYTEYKAILRPQTVRVQVGGVEATIPKKNLKSLLEDWPNAIVMQQGNKQ